MPRFTVIPFALTVAGVSLAGCQMAQRGAAATMRASASATPPAAYVSFKEGSGVTGYSHEKANALYRHAEYARDEALCREAIAAIAKSQGEKSPALAAPLNDLSAVYLRLAQFKEAKAILDRAESVLDKSQREQAIQYAALCINKGWYYYSLGEVPASEDVFKEGKTLLEKFEKKPTVDLAELINNLGVAYGDDDDHPERVKEGKALLLKAWEMRRKLTGENSAESDESLNNIGMYLLFHPQGGQDIQTAINALHKSLKLSEKIYGEENPETAVSRTNMAVGYHLTQQDDLADAEIRKAMPVTEKFFGKEHPDYAYELQVLGQIEQAREKYKEAEGHYQQAVTIMQKVYGPSHTFVASAMDYLEGLYQEMGDEKRQAEVHKRIEKIRGRDL